MTQPASKFSTDAHAHSRPPAPAASVRPAARHRTLPPPPPPAAYDRRRSSARPVPLESLIAPALERTELGPELAACSLFASPLAVPPPAPTPWWKPAAAAAAASTLVVLVAGGSYLAAVRLFDAPLPTLLPASHEHVVARPLTAAKRPAPAAMSSRTLTSTVAKTAEPLVAHAERAAARAPTPPAAPARTSVPSAVATQARPQSTPHSAPVEQGARTSVAAAREEVVAPQPAAAAQSDVVSTQPEPEAPAPTQSTQPESAAVSGEDTAADSELGAPAEGLPEQLSREQVQAGLEQLRGKLAACAGEGHGTTYANVTIAGTGRVSYSTIDGAFAGTPAGSCMARTLRSGAFPKFSGAPLKVRYPYGL